jgi:hypothetical protein
VFSNCFDGICVKVIVENISSGTRTVTYNDLVEYNVLKMYPQRRLQIYLIGIRGSDVLIRLYCFHLICSGVDPNASC